LLMTLTIFFGLSAVTIVSIIAVPALGMLGSDSVGLAVRGGGGREQVTKIVPPTPREFSGALALGVGSCVRAGPLGA
ncbi:cytosine permease, partial [Salmonella enterica subsp. enterica serovar Infantis]